jgi:hypothetical protein
MPSRKPSGAARLADAIARRGYTRVGEEEWQELLTDLAPAAEEVLRRLLRDCGLPLSPMVEGIRIATIGETERTAVALAREYEAAIVLGNRERARSCRRLVVLAKDRARLAAKSARDPERRKEKEEIAAWLLVWLGTPALFPAWVVLRKRASGQSGEAGATPRPVSSSIE